jgi:hypothetical protein
MGANAAPGSTVPGGIGDVGATRRVGKVVVVRRCPPAGGAAVDRGAVGGGAVAGGFVDGTVVGGVVVGGVVVGGVVVGGVVVGGVVVGGVVVDTSTAAAGLGESNIVVPTTVAASTNAPLSRRRRVREGGAHPSTCEMGVLGRGRSSTSGSSPTRCRRLGRRPRHGRSSSGPSRHPRVRSGSRMTRVGTRDDLLASARSWAMPTTGTFAHDRGNAVERRRRRTETRTAPSLLSAATLSPRLRHVKGGSRPGIAADNGW